MSTLTVGWLVDLVELKAQDEGSDDVTEEQWLDFYSLALATLVSLDNRAYTIFEDTQLSAGIEQAIPADGLVLVDIPVNMGTDGKTPGRSIREVDLSAMRALKPSWPSEAQATEIKHFIRIPDMDATWYAFPPSDGTGYVRQVYAATPPRTVYDAADSWKNETIPVSDEYVPALPDLMLHHCYAIDTDYPGAEAQSLQHLEAARKLLNRQLQKNETRR